MTQDELHDILHSIVYEAMANTKLDVPAIAAVLTILAAEYIGIASAVHPMLIPAAVQAFKTNLENFRKRATENLATEKELRNAPTSIN